MDKQQGILQLKNLSVGYSNKTLISNVNTEVVAGSFVLLLGANGVGKSTLLKTITGQLPSVIGEIFINGKTISALDVKSMSKIVSFLPGSLVVPNEVTVLDLLEFARIPYIGRMSRLSESDQKVIDRVVTELALQDWVHSFYMTLSDGEKQIVNIARCLVQETPIIILDEPTAHLDIVNKKRVFQLLSQQSEKGKMIICSSHDLYEAVDHATAFWVVTGKGQFKYLSSNEKPGLDDLKAMLFD